MDNLPDFSAGLTSAINTGAINTSAIARSVDSRRSTTRPMTSVVSDACHELVVRSGSLVVIYQGKGKRFRCLCRETFVSSPALARHISGCSSFEVTSKVIASYECVKCRKPFSKTLEVAQHFGSCIFPQDNASDEDCSPSVSDADCFKCRFCSLTYKTKIGCGQHERHRHAAQLDEVCPVGKVPRWTSTENNLPIQAEAELRIELNLPFNRSVHGEGMNQRILAKIISMEPNFNRTEAAIQARRSQGRHGYINAVKERMVRLTQDRGDRGRERDRGFLGRKPGFCSS